MRVIQQMEAAECGVACLAMMLDHYGAPMALHELRNHCGTSRDGNSAWQLLNAGRALGLRGRGLKLRAERLASAPLPLILHWQRNHFVILERLERGRAILVDPASGRVQVDREHLEHSFSGIALHFEPTSNLVRRRRRSEGSQRHFQSLKGLRAGVAFIMLAGACTQLLGIVAPALNQVLIDQVIQPARKEWLLPLMSVLIGATLAGLALQALYQLTLARIQTVLKTKLTNQLARHLLRLPLEFVGSRSRGDLLQRVTSHAGLAPRLTEAVLALFQAFFVVALALMMLAYDRRIGALSLGIDLLRLAVVRKTREDARQRSAGELAARARENAVVQQATSSAEMVKAFGLEDRLEQWYERRLEDRVRWTSRAARLQSGASSWLAVFDGVARATVIWFGGMKVISFEMPLGVFAGFLAIRGLLTPPLAALWSTVESWLEFRSVLARSDELLSQPMLVRGEQSADALRGRLTLQNVGFRYSSGSPWVFRGVSLNVERGQHVAMIGPSGQGKSTLLQLLAGVLEPSEGEILLDGIPLQACEERSLARKLGTVVGSPLVIDGTIRDNLLLRLPDASDAEVRRAARTACFEEVVGRTSQGYDTRLRSDGTNLSGGERQRLGLAQALLGSPSVLLLDEATCFLDPPTERRILDNLVHLGVTVVSVAHRPAVIEAADRVFLVRDGQVSNPRSKPSEGIRVAPALREDAVEREVA